MNSGNDLGNFLEVAKGVLARVGDVEEAIFILVLLVDAAHEGGGRRQDGVDKDEDNLLRGELDALPDDVDELAYSEICGDEIFLLVDSGDIGLLDLLADYRNTVGIFLTDAFRLGLPLLKGVLVLELRAHVDGFIQKNNNGLIEVPAKSPALFGHRARYANL